MPELLLKSAMFDTMEAVLDPPALTWRFEDAFDNLGSKAGDPKVLQLSSSLIRISQAYWDYSSPTPVKVSYEMRLSGSGITPVSSLSALMHAIDDGLAKGTLSKLEIVQGSTGLLAVTMDAAGYHLTSGDIAITLEGRLPLSFTQLFDLAGLFDQVTQIDTMSRAERAALFDDLGSYAVSGLSLSEGRTELFAVHVAATSASLTLNGLTMTLSGTFPSDLGEDVQWLWNVFQDATTARGVSADAFAAPAFAGISVTGIRFTDATGAVLGTMADPMADTPLAVKVDGKLYDDVKIGSNNGDYLYSYQDKVVLAGLGGSDTLDGGWKSDFLIGGSGDDTLYGDIGNDRLDGGTGRDLVWGDGGADVFHFDLGDGRDRIGDFKAGQDVIEILAAASLADLTFTQINGNVRVDFRSIHILVDDITVAQLDHAGNFHF